MRKYADFVSEIVGSAGFAEGIERFRRPENFGALYGENPAHYKAGVFNAAVPLLKLQQAVGRTGNPSIVGFHGHRFQFLKAYPVNRNG